MGTRYLVCIYRILVCFSGKAIIDACLFCELCQTRAPKKQGEKRTRRSQRHMNKCVVCIVFNIFHVTNIRDAARQIFRANKKKKKNENYKRTVWTSNFQHYVCIPSISNAFYHYVLHFSTTTTWIKCTVLMETDFFFSLALESSLTRSHAA